MSNSVWPQRRQPTRLPVPGILQARTLDWVAISFSNAWKWKVKGKSLSCVRLLATPWTAAYQAPPSMGFSRQEYWRGLPLPSPIFQWVSSFHQVANILYLQLQHQSFQWIFRLISFRIDWFDLFAVQIMVWSPTPQFKSINSSVLSFLYGPTLMSIHDYGKNPSFDYMDLCWQHNFSAFNILSRLVIAFLPRSKCLLISWLQSPSAVILEPKK